MSNGMGQLRDSMSNNMGQLGQNMLHSGIGGVKDGWMGLQEPQKPENYSVAEMESGTLRGLHMFEPQDWTLAN